MATADSMRGQWQSDNGNYYASYEEAVAADKVFNDAKKAKEQAKVAPTPASTVAPTSPNDQYNQRDLESGLNRAAFKIPNVEQVSNTSYKNADASANLARQYNKELETSLENQKNLVETFGSRASEAQSAQNQSRAMQQNAIANSPQQAEARQQQQNFIAQLQQQAAGGGPSLATAQLKAAQDRSLKQQLAAAAASRGGNASALQRTLAKSQADQNAQLAQQSAALKIQEQQQAQQQLAGALQNLRGQDVAAQQQQIEGFQNLRGQDIALQQQAAANQLAAAQGIGSQAQTAQSLQEQLFNQRLQQGFTAQQAQQQALADFEALKNNRYLAEQGVQSAQYMQQKQNQSALIGSLIGGAGAALGKISDKNLKTNIKRESGNALLDKEKSLRESQQSEKTDYTKAASAALETTGSKMSEQSPVKKDGGVYDYASPAEVGRKKVSMTETISDENNKKSISKKDESFNPKDFLDALKAYSYEYKDNVKSDPAAGSGRYLSVMAQDLEKAGPVGRSMVDNTPTGKTVNYGKGFGAILAAQAHLNERLKELEAKKSKKG